MKTAFLEQVAVHIMQSEHEFEHLAVIFPNRRAAVYLRKHLANYLQKPKWLPDIFSIDDFILQVSELQLIPADDLLFEFFETYISINPEQQTHFDDFAEWSGQVLKDYNDIDLNLADASKLFTYISDTKAIELWNPGKDDLSEREQKYLDFFRSLYPLYALLRERLLKNGMAYQGLAYREAAAQIKTKEENPGWKKIVFAGFNALTVAEQSIIHHLKSLGIAEMLWDADHFYLDQEIHEAGMHLRTYLQKETPGKISWINNHFREGPKNISMLGVSGMITQVKAAAQILADLWQQNHDLSSTAVVLGDESLLIPLLNSIPKEITSMNVTMGLPFASIPLHPLFESFIKCHIHAAKTKKGIYFRHLAEILNHAFIHPALVDNQNSPINLTTKLLNSQHIFYTEKDLELFFEDCKFGKYFLSLFNKTESPAELANRCLELCSLMQTIYLHDKPNEGKNASHTHLLNEFVYHYALLFNTILKNIQKYPEAVQLSTFQSLYRSTIRQNNFPFFGEPLKGLQIMGMLETRNLDFQNIIMLNVNEDVIPRGKSNPGFIPYDVRKEFGLPTHHEGQAVSAYHFYRFLQRPENIHLIYNNEPGVINPGGKSRYLLQIARELPAWNPEIIIQDRVLRTSVAESTPDLAYSIPKTEAVMDRIHNLARKGLSATALNTFRQCQMRFYFSKVLMLNEPEDPAEEIDARTFGNILHEVLEKVYANVQGQILSEELLQKIKPGIPDFIAQSFLHYFPQGDTSTGKTHLSLEVSRALLNRFLVMEKNRIQEAKERSQILTIHGLEKEFVSDLTTETGNEVKLYGKIDRIDQSGSEIFLFDYKTGFIKDGELSLKNWDDLYSGLHFDKIFQLLFYAVLYGLQDFNQTSVHTGIISFRQLTKSVQYLKLPDGIGHKDAVKTHFKPYVYSLIDTLLDPAIDITQTMETELCEKCPFSAICYRDSAGLH